MLKRRLIPTLLVRHGSLVKGRSFQSWRPVGVPLQAARIFETRQVDELVLLDIAATPEGRGPDLKMVEAITDEMMMPLAVGGGVRTLEDIRSLLLAGADKVAIGTAAIEHPGFIYEAARKFGSQCITVALDVKAGRTTTHCGARERAVSPVVAARGLEMMGAGEILLTAVERDGTLEGYDLDLIRSVSRAVSIPVIASGGAGKPEDFVAAIEAGAHACAAGAMWSFCEVTPKEAKRWMAEAGIPMRL